MSTVFLELRPIENTLLVSIRSLCNILEGETMKVIPLVFNLNTVQNKVVLKSESIEIDVL